MRRESYQACVQDLELLWSGRSPRSTDEVDSGAGVPALITAIGPLRFLKRRTAGESRWPKVKLTLVETNKTYKSGKTFIDDGEGRQLEEEGEGGGHSVGMSLAWCEEAADVLRDRGSSMSDDTQ